jgi:hypothetical protein
MHHVGRKQRQREEDQAQDEYPMKLCPLRDATRAGQKARATQTHDKSTQPKVEAARTYMGTSPLLANNDDKAAAQTRHPCSIPARVRAE